MRNRIFAPLLCFYAALSPACVELHDDPDAHEHALASDDAFTAVTAEPEAQASAELAAAIAAHPAYAQLSAFAWGRAQQNLGDYAALDEATLDEEYERLEYCRTQTNLVACYEELSGVGAAIDISNGVRTAGQQLVTAFGLGSMSVEDRIVLFHAAQQAYVAAGGPGGSPSMIPNSLGGRACDAACKTDSLAELALVQAAWVTAATVSTGGGNDGGGGVLGQLIIDTLVVIVRETIKDWLDCLLDPDCDTWPEGSGVDECDDDSDCLPDGWCYEGPLGFGDNECRDKKEEGEPCSRDAKCESDCCKFSLWDLGSTCRDADECN